MDCKMFVYNLLHLDNLAEVKKRKLLLAIEGSSFSDAPNNNNPSETADDATAVCIIILKFMLSKYGLI